MSDGEVSVSVRAEGVEDAAGEMDPDAAAATGGEGGPMGQVSQDTSRIVKVLGVIAAVIAIFEDVLDLVTVVANILRAFVAPLAVILMRLFQPVLRILLQLLPAWMSFIDENEGEFATLLAGLVPWVMWIPSVVDAVRGMWDTLKGVPGRIGAFIDNARDRIGDVVDGVRELPSRIGAFIDNARDRIGDVVDGVKTLPSRIWSFMERLPGLIGDAVSDVLPDLPGTGAADTARDLGGRFDEATGGRLSDAAETVVNIGGGLTPFVEEITQNGSIDFP